MENKSLKIILSGNAIRDILSIILVLTLIFNILTESSMMARAATIRSNVPSKELSTTMADQGAVYVALGDSVPAGFGLSDANDCYVKLFSDQMTESGYNNTMYNYAVSGSTTGNLKSFLKKMKTNDPAALQTLKNASIITVNIGGNNVLGPLVQAVNEKLEEQIKTMGITNIKDADPVQLLTLGVLLYTMDLDTTQLEKIKEGAQKFDKDYPKIMKWLRTNAPNANIIVSTIYNPLPETLSFYQTSETMLEEMNALIKKDAKENGYYLADVYSSYVKEQGKGSQITNLNLGQYKESPISVDIHPNAAGHKLIAKIYNNTFQKLPIVIKTDTNSPVTVSMAISGKVDKKGNLTTNITKKILNTVIDKAQTKAKYLGRESDDIGVVFKNTNTEVKNLNVTFDGDAIDLLKSIGVQNISFNTNVFCFSFDKAALNEIDKDTEGNIIVKAACPSNLSQSAEKLIGSRPAFKMTMKDTKGNIITDLGKGKMTLNIRYTAKVEENINNLYVIYVGNNGRPAWFVDSTFSDDWIGCTNNTLATYGVGYKQ